MSFLSAVRLIQAVSMPEDTASRIRRHQREVCKTYHSQRHQVQKVNRESKIARSKNAVGVLAIAAREWLLLHWVTPSDLRKCVGTHL